MGRAWFSTSRLNERPLLAVSGHQNLAFLGPSERPVLVRADIGPGRMSAFHAKAAIELE